MYLYELILYKFRVFKQALQSAGGQLTQKHVEEVSLGVLFLMKAAKMTDKAFKVKAPSTTHTIREAESDVLKMVVHLRENEVQKVKKDRTTPVFTDPTEAGWKRISTTTWLKDTLSKSIELDNSETTDNLQDQDIDMTYELADTSLI